MVPQWDPCKSAEPINYSFPDLCGLVLQRGEACNLQPVGAISAISVSLHPLPISQGYPSTRTHVASCQRKDVPPTNVWLRSILPIHWASNTLWGAAVTHARGQHPKLPQIKGGGGAGFVTQLAPSQSPWWLRDRVALRETGRGERGTTGIIALYGCLLTLTNPQ